MKAIITMGSILIALIGFSLLSDIYMAKTTDMLIESINELETSENKEEALEKYIELWNEKSDNIEFFIDHEEIDLINNYLWSMQGYLKQDMEDEFMFSLAVTRKMIEHISLKNKLALSNIF